MNKLPFNSIFSMIALCAIILFSSCEKDKVKIVDNTASAYTLEGTYSESKVLTADQVWMLKGRVIFKSGTKLTIEPGTIIKAEGGTGANASVIIIARGATISAEGTATQPIIFTSVADDIIKGQIAGTNFIAKKVALLFCSTCIDPII